MYLLLQLAAGIRCQPTVTADVSDNLNPATSLTGMLTHNF